MALNDITREGVLSALAEYDQLGQTGFFQKYGFESATKFWLVHNNRAYASKAVANVAQATGMNRAYAHDIRLSGGEATVVRRLRDLGFAVPASGHSQSNSRADTWSREELILALDLYMQSPHSPPGKGSPEVIELTRILGRLASLRGQEIGPKFRNENGVYLKMMNFRRFDPVFLSQGKKGMERGGKLEGEVWAEFTNDIAALQQAALLIRAAADDSSVLSELQNIGADDGDGAAEGGFSYRLHKRYERDRKIVEKKKASTLTKHGCLKCECCSFDFSSGYGSMGFGYIEAHHRKPVFKMKVGEKTRHEDLALLCSNCHRMIHSRREPLTIEEVKQAVEKQRSATQMAT